MHISFRNKTDKFGNLAYKKVAMSTVLTAPDISAIIIKDKF